MYRSRLWPAELQFNSTMAIDQCLFCLPWLRGGEFPSPPFPPPFPQGRPSPLKVLGPLPFSPSPHKYALSFPLRSRPPLRLWGLWEHISSPVGPGRALLPHIFWCILGINLNGLIAQWLVISFVFCSLKESFSVPAKRRFRAHNLAAICGEIVSFLWGGEFPPPPPQKMPRINTDTFALFISVNNVTHLYYFYACAGRPRHYVFALSFRLCVCPVEAFSLPG